MDSSPYLVQALQQLQRPAPTAPTQTLSPQQLQQMQQKMQGAQAWKAANPDQSYMAHGMQQMGQNLAAAPGNVMSGLGNLAALFRGGG